MNILMIGGTRFFGKRFVELMLEQGHSVTLLTRGQMADGFGARVTRLIADRTNKTQLESVIKSDYDVVIDNMLMNAEEANSIMTILRGRIGHYVMTSTLSVYDAKPGALIESDFEAKNNSSYTSSNPYQLGKRAAEHALTFAPFRVSIMRIPIIVGPDDYTKRLLSHVEAVKESRKFYFPNPEASFSYLHAKDAARALSWLSSEKVVGTFNISAPDAWTITNLMEEIQKVVGKKFIYGEPSDAPSPFGITDDYFMNVEKSQAAGFQVMKLKDWMPALINELAALPKSNF